MGARLEEGVAPAIAASIAPGLAVLPMLPPGPSWSGKGALGCDALNFPVHFEEQVGSLPQVGDRTRSVVALPHTSPWPSSVSFPALPISFASRPHLGVSENRGP